MLSLSVCGCFDHLYRLSLETSDLGFDMTLMGYADTRTQLQRDGFIRDGKTGTWGGGHKRNTTNQE